jgi:LysM repeat protein
MVAGLLALAGCATLTPDYVPPAARVSADAGLAGDVKALQEWRQEARLEQESQARDIEALRKQVRELEASVRENQQAVKVQFQDLETSREQDKNFIIAELTKKLTTIQGALTPPPPPAGGGSKTGFEHVVKPGETLSVIAKGYKSSVETILKANNLKSANAIKVGQKLFIPD